MSSGRESLDEGRARTTGAVCRAASGTGWRKQGEEERDEGEEERMRLRLARNNEGRVGRLELAAKVIVSRAVAEGVRAIRRRVRCGGDRGEQNDRMRVAGARRLEREKILEIRQGCWIKD